MKIGVFTKFEMSGGSEHRAIELAGAISKYTTHESFLLVEHGDLKKELRSRVADGVRVITDVMAKPDIFYDLDRLLVINTDSNDFTTIRYWSGETDRHSACIDLRRVKSMTFLFNFIVSPARHLADVAKLCGDISILTTNQRFFDEITRKDKHAKIRQLPRMILESPINQNTVYTHKSASPKIRIGKHSCSLGAKWNAEHRDLILRLNARYDNLIWDFMGAGGEFTNSVQDIPNVINRKGFSIPVNVYLCGIDIFLFYPRWNRQEPWSRAVAEALMSGCPVVATDIDGGNRMQVLHGNNGFLCGSLDEFEKYLSMLIEDAELRSSLGKNARIYSRFFTSEHIIKKLMMFWGI